MTPFRDCVSFWLKEELFMKKNPPSPEKIWATLQEAGENIKKASEQIKDLSDENGKLDKKSKEAVERLNRISNEVGDLKLLSAKNNEQIKENLAEVGEKIKELSAETKKTDKGLREARELFTSQWGRLIESFVKGGLVDLLKEKNIDVEAVLGNMNGVYEGKNWEIDLVAINGTEVVVVEVKTTLRVKDISHFAKKLDFFTNWRTEYKGKKVYGAVAYIRANEHSTKYAEKQGLFVIRATGNNATIINKENFKPKTYY